MRWPHRYKVYNVLHKSVVSVLMGITFLATFMTGVHGVHYFREIRPKQREEQRIMLEEKLAKEQAEKEQELLMSRQESETL